MVGALLSQAPSSGDWLRPIPELAGLCNKLGPQSRGLATLRDRASLKPVIKEGEYLKSL